MTKTKIFIDFDDTLFDRGRFVPDLFGIIEKFGFTDDEIISSYQMVYHDGYDGVWAHMKFLHDKVRPFDLSLAETKMKEFLDRTSSYLFPEAMSFLQGINKNFFDIQLLTVGGINFQKMKIEGAGISKFFDYCNYTTKNKAATLNSLVSTDDFFILVEDKDREIKEVNKKFPYAMTIQVRDGKLLKNLELINAKASRGN